ncbi:MAG: 4-hydroxythreonine-4-phosphate dehydrogenase PdxA, partial [Bacteroidales bacterium]|nr:4-hydroxythreonine-4-phosphate dehydrogenase PdxA [Bacteroidales bacterium]
HSKRANLVNCYDKEVKIEMGKVRQAAGELSVVAMEAAVEDLKKNNIDVLVTAPINKYSIQSQNFNYPGHTEFLADKFKVENHLMLMVSDICKIGIATNHVAVKDVSANLSIESIYNKIKVMNHTLIRDFAVRMPKIAVLSLNPHKGDKGVIGTEEESVIIPAISKAYEEKALVYGPYAADGFFRDGNYSKFDAVLAMYHDQGLIPFKMMAFENGVNYTAGLPVIRTSPDHGTGFEIAGKNVASPCSFRSALFLACTIFKNRSAYDSDTANPLKSQYIEKENPNKQ